MVNEFVRVLLERETSCVCLTYQNTLRRVESDSKLGIRAVGEGGGAVLGLLSRENTAERNTYMGPEALYSLHRILSVGATPHGDIVTLKQKPAASLKNSSVRS